MAQNETWLTHDLLEAVKVQYLDGNLFSMDNAGNLIGVTLTRDGEDYAGGGSVSANVIRADGGTVAVSGAISGNTATVVLPQAAYAVPGVVSVVVKLTASGQVTTIAAIVANVYRSSTDTAIDPGTIIPSVQALIAAIDTAVASIPADYSSLWVSLAPAFSTSSAYTAGQYVTYNGGLYRFTADHAAGAWNSAHVTAVNIGGELSDLKSALYNTIPEVYNAVHWEKPLSVSSGYNRLNFYSDTNEILNGGTTYLIKLEKEDSSIDAKIAYAQDENFFVSAVGNTLVSYAIINNASDVGLFYIWSSGTGAVTISSYIYDIQTDTTLTMSGVPADAKATGDKIKAENDMLGVISPTVFSEKKFTKTATCTQNTWKNIAIYQNPYYILKAGKTYLFKAFLSNQSASANIQASNSGSSQLFLHVDGTETAYGFATVVSDVGNLYVYANQNTDITIEVFTVPENEEYDVQVGSSAKEVFLFQFKKGKRYSVVVDFGETVEMTGFGMSISKTDSWNTGFTPITQNIFKGDKVERHFTSIDDFNAVVLRLTGITTGQDMSVSIEEIEGTQNPCEIVIAASDAPYDDKMVADFVCSGHYDEYMIVSAYEYAYWSRVGTVKLANGKYNIQSFPFTVQGTKCAIPLRAGSQAQGAMDIVIKGANCAYGFSGSRFPNGTVLYVDETGYNSIGNDEEVALFKADSATSVISGCAITLEDCGIYVYGSQKKLTAIDLQGGDRIYLNRLVLVGYTNELINDPSIGRNPPVAVPIDGFTGIRMGTGSNDPIGYTFRHVGVWGFYEGFKVGGEHLLMEQCAATIGVYGFTFCNYEYGANPNAIVHPITMINCCDERNQNFPLFKRSGFNQQITMIDFNLEQVTEETPGNVFYNYMTDETGGRICGEITYTIMDKYNAYASGGNVVNRKLWADGNGLGFVSHNAAQKHMGTTAERLTYAPNYHQQYYDTDLDKLVICIDPSTKTWVDVNGNVVD